MAEHRMVSRKGLRKLLNKAWDKGKAQGAITGRFTIGPTYINVVSYTDRRYRDVSKILKEAIPKPPKEANNSKET